MTEESGNFGDNILNMLPAPQLPKSQQNEDRNMAEYKEELELEDRETFEQDVSYDYTDRSKKTEQDYLEFGETINRDLKKFSIPFPYKGRIDFTFKNVESRVRVVNTILDLLNQREQSKEFIIEAQEVIRKLGVAKRDVKQRTQTVLKECNEQSNMIKKLKEKQNNKQREYDRKNADLHDKLEEILREKRALEFRAKQNITDNKKKDKIIKELRARAKSLMNFQETRVTLGLRSINEQDIFTNSGVNRKGKMDQNELLKEELMSKKRQIEYLAKENQNIRHDLAVLRQEVKRSVPLFGGTSDDLYEDNLSLDFEADPLGGGMQYANPEVRKDSSIRKPVHAHNVSEGRRSHHTSIAPGGEDHEGEVASKGSSAARPAKSNNAQPGSMVMSNSIPMLSELDLDMSEMDINFEEYIDNEPNPAGDFEDGANVNVEDYAWDPTGLGKDF